MIGRIVTLGFLILNTLASFYYAGAYANGKKEVKQGKAVAASYGFSAIITGILSAALYFDW